MQMGILTPFTSILYFRVSPLREIIFETGIHQTVYSVNGVFPEACNDMRAFVQPQL